jgi:hypothetical protein
MVEFDPEPGEVGAVFFVDFGDKLFFGNAFFTGRDGDRGAVRVVGAEVTAVFAAQFLEPNPNVRLNVFDEVPDVNVAVGVRERARY